MVQEWSRPSSKKQVRSFLGLCSYYRRFVQKFATIARPLHRFSEKAVKFQWSDDTEEAFNKLKTALTTSPVLAYPKLGQPFILDTDSSDFASGAVLSQDYDGKERVLAYMSKSLNTHERTYCVTRKELLAVIVALKKFHTYLYGQKVFLRTDNSAVSWMKNLKTPTGQMARWIQELGVYDLTVVHRKGRKHTNADALSRVPCKVCRRYADKPEDIGEIEELEQCNIEANDNVLVTNHVRVVTRSQIENKHMTELLEGWDSETIKQDQKSDEDIGTIYGIIENEQAKPTWRDISAASPHTKILWAQWDRLSIHSGMLYRSIETDKRKSTQLVVPKKHRDEVMKLNHDIPTAAHLGQKPTLKRVQNDFFWPEMKTDINNYVVQGSLTVFQTELLSVSD